MTGDLFHYYLTKVWYPEVRKKISQNVCVIVDNCNAHGTGLPPLQGVEYIPLPPNVTSLYQPMDQGIIRGIKSHARADLLRQVIKTLDSRAELRELGNKQRPGMTGLRYGHAAHMLDAFQIFNRAMEKITRKAVAHCWCKAGILSGSQTRIVCEGIGEQIEEKSNKKIVAVMRLSCLLLTKMEMTESDSDCEKGSSETDEDDIILPEPHQPSMEIDCNREDVQELVNLLIKCQLGETGTRLELQSSHCRSG